MILKPLSGATDFWHLSVAFGGNTKQGVAVISATGAQTWVDSGNVPMVTVTQSKMTPKLLNVIILY